MAASWNISKQNKRRWTSLNVDETPGMFRRLDENEATRADWPAATLPSSVLNGQQGKEGYKDRHAKDGKGCHKEGLEEGHKDGLKEGFKKGHKESNKKGHKENKDKSASLPHPKREGKPSLFTAFTWSKGKKARPKLNEGETPADEGGVHSNTVTPTADRQQEDDPHSGASNSVLYSERGVDVPEDVGSLPQKPASSSSSSSSSGSESASHERYNKNDAPSPSDKTSKEKTETPELPNAEPTNHDERPQPGEPTRSSSKKEESGKTERQTEETGNKETPSPGSTQKTGKQTSVKPNNTTGEGASPADTAGHDEEDRGGRDGSFDTGRRFRLEATVMVDDERPAERRVTYLGPVLLSPLDRRSGQYVHVTVAPGSGTAAVEGSSLMVRPARPVLVRPNDAAATPTKVADTKGDEDKPKVNQQDREEEAKIIASSATASPPCSSPELPITVSSVTPVAEERRCRNEMEKDVMEMTQATIVTLGTTETPARSSAAESATEDNLKNTVGDRCDESYHGSDTLPLDPGQEQLTVKTETREVELWPAPSPIPVDQSVFGTTRTSMSPSDEVGRMVFPASDTGRYDLSLELTRAPKAPYRRHKRSKSSSSSSTSSLSSSSTSSNDSKSKQKSYEFSGQEGKPEHLEITKSPEQTIGETHEMQEAKAIIADLECSERSALAEESRQAETDPNVSKDDDSVVPVRRPRPDLLDPHVLLASEGGTQKPTSRETSPAAENRCDLKSPMKAAVHRPEPVGTTLLQSSTLFSPENDHTEVQREGPETEAYVLGVSEGTDSDGPHEGVFLQDSIEDGSEKSEGRSAEIREAPVMRQCVSRPQKPARTSLIKEDIIIASTAPLDTAVDRPPLPLKRTPRTSSSSSSSSSSSDTEDVDGREKRPGSAENAVHDGELLSKLTEASAPEVLSHGLERKTDGMDVKLGHSADTANYSLEYECRPRLSETSFHTAQNTSSTSSSQYITDSSLAEPVDLPELTEVEIIISSTGDASLTSAPAPPRGDDRRHNISTSSNSSSHKAGSDSDKSSRSSKHGTKDSRKPPVFVTPPPPPTKPVRSCGSQSDLSDRSDMDHDFGRTPPKPARSTDRLSANLSDLDKKKAHYTQSASASPPPVVPPRREKPKINGAELSGPPGRPNSAEPSPHASFTSSEDDSRRSPRSKQKHDTKPASPPPSNSTEHAGCDMKLSPASAHSANRGSGDLESSTFIPYEDSEIYYKDVAFPQRGNMEQPDFNSSQTSSSSEQGKRGKSPKEKGRRSEKSGSSSDESKLTTELDPPPVPPRQKVGSKKAAPDLNTSSSSSTSHGSRTSHDRPTQTTASHGKLPELPKTMVDVPTECVLEGSDVVPKFPEMSPPQISVHGKLDLLPKTPSADMDKMDELTLPPHEEVIVSDVQSPSLYLSLGTPVTEVQLPTRVKTPSPKPPRTPSPKVGKHGTPSPKSPRTPSPKFGSSRTPSPNPPRSPSPKVDSPRTPSPGENILRTPSPQASLEVIKSSMTRPVSSPVSCNLSIDVASHTDEDTSEADVRSSVYRSVSMSSTTSVTSQEGEKGDNKKGGSRSGLRKYWPFRRRKKSDKKDPRRKERGREEGEMSVSSPHLPSALPLHQSTPTLERHASDPNTAGTTGRVADSDTSTLSESANEQSLVTKPKDKREKDKKEREKNKKETQKEKKEREKEKKVREQEKKERDKGNKEGLSTSTSSSDHKGGRNKKEKEKKKKSDKDQKDRTSSSVDERSFNSSRDTTPVPERIVEMGKPTERRDYSKHDKDPEKKHKEHDTSTSSSGQCTLDTSRRRDTEPPLLEPPLAPPRVTSPLREQPPPQYHHQIHQPPATELHQPRFDGEFQRMDEDIQPDADHAASVVERRPPMVVVAVDLGTTHSGYAFSFSRDPSSVYVMSRWAGQEPGLLNHKTLSALLLTPDARFHSFGLAARNHYHNLLPIEARHWLYFERFKMTLHHCKELSRDTMVSAVNGKQLPALTVFAHVLQFFVTHALQQLSDQSGTEFRSQDVRWVLTVPAIWREPAKQLMRQAALEGGMFTRADPSQLLIVLEPEAASIYCRRLRMHQLVPEVGAARPLQSPRRSMELLTNNTPAVNNLTVDGSRSCESLDSLSETTLENKIKGTRYVVVDCGGGTVDITVHELTDTGQLAELHRATGGPHGSTGVDMEFEALLSSIFSRDFIENYKRQFPVGWVNLMTDFESRKRTASPFKTTSFNVSLPFTFISEFRKHKGEVEQAVKRHGDPDVEWSLQGMLRLAPPAMRRLFAPTLVSIRQAIGDVLNNPNTRELRYLFLVGGFAESPVLQHEVRREFGHLLTVLIPQDVSLAVLRGAVLFGLDPRVVSVRCARLTYGVGILNRFDSTRHPIQKRVHRDGVDWCTDVFDRFVAINQPVSLGTSVLRRYTPARSGQLLIVLNIYSSVNPVPSFITDPGVRKCGTLYLDLRQSLTDSHDSEKDAGEVGVGVEWDQPREILTRMAFGDTEISVTALDVTSGKEVKASVDFLTG